MSFISWWTVTAYVYNTVYSELTACNPLSLADSSTAANKAAYASMNNNQASHRPIAK